MIAAFKTPDGSIDWEQVFEHPDVGFVTLIEQATTRRGLERASSEVVQQLFQRKDDDEKRESFQKLLNHLFAAGADGALPETRKRVLMVMRQVKTDRIKRAALAAEQRASAERREAAEAAAAEAAAGPSDPTAMLADAFLQAMTARLEALSKDIDPSRAPEGRVPYLLSPVFAERFIAILREAFMPDMPRAFRALLTRAEGAGFDAAEEVIREAFAHPSEDAHVWPAWRALWFDKVEEKELPEKPKPQPKKKKGLIARLLEDDDEPDWAKPMTFDEWKAEVAELKAGNAEARALWARIAETDGTFVEPTDADREVLADLFAVSPSALETDVKAILQMASEKTGLGRTFDNYAKKRDLDLALLVSAHRQPNTFFGKRQSLKTILAVSRGQARERDYPLTERFLGAFIR